MIIVSKVKRLSTSSAKFGPWKPYRYDRNYCSNDDKKIETGWKVKQFANWVKNFLGDEVVKSASKIIAALKPDISHEYWHQLLKALGTIMPMKVEWKGDPAKDPNLYVLTLPTGFKWPTLASPHLFIRTRYDCYEKIWNAIEEAYLKRQKANLEDGIVEFERVLIQGNSGIGKTAFLNYALYRAIQKGYPVLLETKKHRVFFQDGKVEKEDIQEIGALSKYQDDPRVLVLHDHKPRSEPPILTNGAFVIAPVSPDERNSHQFRRDKCLELWMPLPTRQELHAMNSIELQLSFDVLESRIDYFGPITRFCLASTVEEYEKYRRVLRQKLQSFRYTDLSQMLRVAMVPPIQEHGLSWWIIHLDATQSLKDPIIYWSSPQIFDEVTKITDDNALAQLEGFVADQLRARSPSNPPPSFEYQKWATYKLAQGMALPFRYFAADGSLESSESPLHLSKSEVRRDYFYKISLEALKSQQTTLFSSSNPNAVLCDIATIIEDGTLILFQATIGLVHSLNLKYLKEFADKAKKYEVKKIRLIYVVPDIEAFKVQTKDLESALEFIKNESLQSESLDVRIAVAKLKPQFFRPNSLSVDNRS
jgi:hypothetical protein